MSKWYLTAASTPECSRDFCALYDLLEIWSNWSFDAKLLVNAIARGYSCNCNNREKGSMAEGKRGRPDTPMLHSFHPQFWVLMAIATLSELEQFWDCPNSVQENGFAQSSFVFRGVQRWGFLPLSDLSSLHFSHTQVLSHNVWNRKLFLKSSVNQTLLSFVYMWHSEMFLVVYNDYFAW